MITNIRLLHGKEMNILKLDEIKKLLDKHSLPVWKLIRTMGISRNKFYELSHQNFKGATTQLQKALNKLGVN